MFKAYEIKPDVYWVGVIEWSERYIHGFSMPNGSTNNAYLIMDEHITLVDTCLSDFSEELIERIADVVDPSKIEYIISNHSEKDHAGSLARMLEVAPNAKLVTSTKGHQILQTYLGTEPDFMPMKDGDTLSIGKRTLTFIHTPMVHWPDNMVTYSESDTLLFSNDAFGQFFATGMRYDDEVDEGVLFYEAKKYFANIITPYARQTAKAVAAVRKLDLDMIAPAHGIIWRSKIGKILGEYDKWCALEPVNKAVVVYCGMYDSTMREALAITEAFMYCRVPVRLYNLDVSDISDIMADMLDAKYVAVGSPTHNMTVLPPMGQFLTYMKGLAPKGRTGIAFGSYGWAQAGPMEIESVMKQCGFDLPLDDFTPDWNETKADEEAAFEAVVELIKG